MYSSFDRLEVSVRDSVVDDDYSSALDAIKNFVFSMMSAQSAPGQIVGSSRLDDLCKFVGESYFSRYKKDIINRDKFSPKENEIVIICTGLYRYGGTSLVIGDLIKAHQDCKCTVLVTNLLSDMSEEDLSSPRIKGVNAEILVSQSTSAGSKLDWLMEKIAKISPYRVFLLNHHQDSVIISAIQPFLGRTKVIYYHHADYNICLGVHVQGAIHVDPHNVGFHNCRKNESIVNNYYLPLTADDAGVSRVGKRFIKDGKLITCSSGTYHKFVNFYLYPYANLIVERLVIRGGIHIHVGNIPEPELMALVSIMIEKGVDPKRFVHIAWTVSLWTTLIENNVDLFIGSFPIGGARTTIEAMGAGLPILMPENYLSRFHGSRDIVYPGAPVWKFPSDFITILMSVNEAFLQKQSVRSRAHFVANYSSVNIDLKHEVDRICAELPTVLPPSLYDYNPDPLDKLLHFIHLEYVTANNAAVVALRGIAKDSRSESGYGASSASRSDPWSRVMGRLPIFGGPLNLTFYRAAYSPEFNHMTNEQLSKHYKDFGRREGRSPNLESFVKKLERQHGRLPEGFDEHIYFSLNPDVALHCGYPGGGIQHYLTFGRAEGRRY